MNCKYLKVKQKKGRKFAYCALLEKEIQLTLCKYCDTKMFREIKPYLLKKKPNKSEKHRHSIIYQDLTKCAICPQKRDIEINEVYEGSFRQRSIDNGMCIPLCHNCHSRFHNDSEFNLDIKVKFEKEYLKTHSTEDFIKLFGQDYIVKLEHKKRARN